LFWCFDLWQNEVSRAIASIDQSDEILAALQISGMRLKIKKDHQ